MELGASTQRAEEKPTLGADLVAPESTLHIWVTAKKAGIHRITEEATEASSSHIDIELKDRPYSPKFTKRLGFETLGISLSGLKALGPSLDMLGVAQKLGLSGRTSARRQFDKTLRAMERIVEQFGMDANLTMYRSAGRAMTILVPGLSVDFMPSHASTLVEASYDRSLPGEIRYLLRLASEPEGIGEQVLPFDEALGVTVSMLPSRSAHVLRYFLADMAFHQMRDKYWAGEFEANRELRAFIGGSLSYGGSADWLVLLNLFGPQGAIALLRETVTQWGRAADRAGILMMEIARREGGRLLEDSICFLQGFPELWRSIAPRLGF